MSQTLWSRLDRILRYSEDAATWLSALILLVAMVLVSVDALCRYLFNAPLTFQYTLTELYLMVAMICLPMAWGFRTGGYIRIDGLINRMPARLGDAVMRGGLVVSGLYVGALAWTAGQHFWKSYSTDEVAYGVINWPLAWSWIWIPIGCGLLCLRLLLCAFGPAPQLRPDPHASEHIE